MPGRTTPRPLPRRPMRVNFARNDVDLLVAVLGELGMSTAYILECTGLSPCQVAYRLFKAQVRRKDYRNGHSDTAKRVQAVAMPTLRQSTRRRLRRKLHD